MQYIQQSLKINHLLQLQHAIFTPTHFGCLQSPIHLKPYLLPLPSVHHALLAPLPSFWQRKLKLAIQLLGVAVLVLPNKSLTANAPLTGVEKVQITKTLTVATTDQHTFWQAEHIHGFAYDAARRYADHLGATLTIQSYPDEQSAIAAVQSGVADIALSDTKTQDTLFTSLACTQTVNTQTLDKLDMTQAGFVFHHNNTALMNHAQAYLCSPKVQSQTQIMSKFYHSNALEDAYNILHFERAIDERLPKYKQEFQRQASKYNQDWQLLVAISYQESHLLPTAVSPTGVEGLMMLTRDTAAAMGVDDRTDAHQSIQGGARYLSELEQLFAEVPQSERLWFVLAAYNMGPNAVKNIQNDLIQAGKNPNRWSNVYTYLSANIHQNSRYGQCIHYVTNIRTYFEELKSEELAA